MYLGIIDFGFDRFYLFGFLGYIIIIAYFILAIKHRKNKTHGFEFSILVYSIYFIFLLIFTIDVKANATYFNQIWFIPFLLCIIVEPIIYLFGKIGKNNNENESENSGDEKL